MKKSLAFLLVLALAVCMLPGLALAEEAPTFDLTNDLEGIKIPDDLVTCICTTTNVSKKYGQLLNGFSASILTKEGEVWTVIISVKLDVYKDQFNKDTGSTHTPDMTHFNDDFNLLPQFKLKYEEGKWVLDGEMPKNKTLRFTCDGNHTMPQPEIGTIIKKTVTGLPNDKLPGSFTFQIKKDGNVNDVVASVTVYREENGSTYKPETVQLPPGNYTVEEIINNDVQVVGYILTAPEAQNFTIEAGQITEVTFTNEYVEEPFPGVITVKKTVESNVPADKDKEFKFKVTVLIPIDPNPDPYGPPIYRSANAAKAPAVKGANKTATNKDFVQENGIWTLPFTLKDGDTMTISNLPVGFTYRVEELDAAGYTVTVNNETTTSKDVALTKENPTETLNFKNTKGSTVTPTPTPTPYNGGGGHGHYYPTTTPVPVIVIPPKTGDMTVWQSILHFLGIR